MGQDQLQWCPPPDHIPRPITRSSNTTGKLSGPSLSPCQLGHLLVSESHFAPGATYRLFPLAAHPTELFPRHYQCRSRRLVAGVGQRAGWACYIKFGEQSEEVGLKLGAGSDDDGIGAGDDGESTGDVGHASGIGEEVEVEVIGLVAAEGDLGREWDAWSRGGEFRWRGRPGRRRFTGGGRQADGDGRRRSRRG